MKRLSPLLAVLLVCSGVAAVIIVPGPGAKHSVAAVQNPFDTMESYTPGVGLNGLNGGTLFGGPYVDKANITGVQSVDTMESYSDGASLDGLNAGGFGGAYTDRANLTGYGGFDNLESYTDGANLNGLNGGTGWAGPFVDR